jgi:hypothetical protein
MPATYSKNTRTTRAPLSPKTIAVRLFVLLMAISMFLSIFVFPWMFAGGR